MTTRIIFILLFSIQVQASRQVQCEKIMDNVYAAWQDGDDAGDYFDEQDWCVKNPTIEVCRPAARLQCWEAYAGGVK